MSLQGALQWCGVYAIVVAFGLIRMNFFGASEAKGDTIVDKMVKPIQVVYNTVQVSWLLGVVGTDASF
jgi:hypothetical protein